MPVLEVADPEDTALLTLKPVPTGLRLSIRHVGGKEIAYVVLKPSRVRLIQKAIAKYVQTGKVL